MPNVRFGRPHQGETGWLNVQLVRSRACDKGLGFLVSTDHDHLIRRKKSFSLGAKASCRRSILKFYPVNIVFVCSLLTPRTCISIEYLCAIDICEICWELCKKGKKKENSWRLPLTTTETQSFSFFSEFLPESRIRLASKERETNFFIHNLEKTFFRKRVWWIERLFESYPSAKTG